MSLVIIERPLSRPVSVNPGNSTVKLEYWVRGTNDENQVKALVLSTIGISFDALYLDTIDIVPMGGAYFWYVTVTYNVPEYADPYNVVDPLAPLSGEFSFTTAGGTAHLTQSQFSYGQTGRQTTPGNPLTALPVPNTMQAIGISRDGVQGVDIIAPKLEFTVVKKFPQLTLVDIATFSTLTGTVCNAPFYGQMTGEVLLEEVTGRYAGDNDQVSRVDVTFKFAIQKNLWNIQICPGLVVPFKGGWDYLWVGYEDQPDSNANLPIRRPRFASVESVYRDGDLTLLGIGT